MLKALNNWADALNANSEAMLLKAQKFRKETQRKCEEMDKDLETLSYEELKTKYPNKFG